MVFLSYKNNRLHFFFELSMILISDLGIFLPCYIFPSLLNSNDWFEAVRTEMISAAASVTWLVLFLHVKANSFFYFCAQVSKLRRR